MHQTGEAALSPEQDKPPVATVTPEWVPATSQNDAHDGPKVDEFGLAPRLPQEHHAKDESSDGEYDSAVEETAIRQETPVQQQPTIVTHVEPSNPKQNDLEPDPTPERKPEPELEGHAHDETADVPGAKGLGRDLGKDGASDLPPPRSRGREPEPRTPVDETTTRGPTEGGGSRGHQHTDSRSKAEQLVFPKTLDAPMPLHGTSEWSHQRVVAQKDEAEEPEAEEQWQEMPAFAPFNMYNDDGKLIAREAAEASDEEAAVFSPLGGRKGYTRVNMDEDAQSATSLDENTRYLFKEADAAEPDDADEVRDPLAQLQATKDLLTEQQRIAYVGVTRVAMYGMVKDLEEIEPTKATRKELQTAAEAMKMWSQKMIVRLYAHMEISSAEQIMIEQLAEHGVQPGDLTPTLMHNARVRNPMAALDPPAASSAAPDAAAPSPRPSPLPSPRPEDERASPAPPPYEAHQDDELPAVRTPSQLPTTKNIDIDLRWTVLCDLFLVLIADSIYDARSRVLLEKVGAFMDVPWLEICKFEKRVTDALEMQEADNKEKWNEDEHLETRRKMAAKRRVMMMGIATVGGSLVIGLSAGLLAPVIGAGLAAGFTTIGVAGTSGFLAGAGGAAVITTIGVTTGGVIAVKSTSRRMGSVKTFEYRPLHNNKRVNLIVTVSGWMTGDIDDVRLPYSTVDPIMGDIYSLLWEPEMLQSMGQTINILATEALTQGLQQVLGSTVLVALMASLQLPIVLTKLSYLIDNPWTVSLDRATSAGQILADSLIDRNLGVRPVTLVGFSLGARVIHSCLRELASRGAIGLVQNVYLFGSPIVAKRDEYLRARTVVSGRFVNGYAKNDWILGYLFRATSGGIMRIAGLAPVENIPGLENIDVTEFVPGHMSYRAAMPRLLREAGWMVDNDTFAEIEDPDPDNHQGRHREIIAEIDEARKELDEASKDPKKAKKSMFGFFGRGKKAPEKKEWETYDESRADAADGGAERERERERELEPRNSGALFDVDAIRAELASEQIQVKQLESTLPPMRLDLGAPPAPTVSTGPYGGLSSSRSYESEPTIRAPTHDGVSSSPSLVNGGSATTAVVEKPLPAVESSPRTSTAYSPRLEEPSEPRPTPISPIPANRPEPRRSVTAAAPVTDLDHNAWLDEEEFGQEKEVTMSFE
ncbi:MAG: hypothetical protein M1838_004403 [Thelocarpon superellum]|nr:MAG: hypothetical protein M1838_004403 [Thelocarpon superellum]